MSANIHWGSYPVPQTTSRETAYILGQEYGYGAVKYFQDDVGYINALYRMYEVMLDRGRDDVARHIKEVHDGLVSRTYDTSNGMPDIEGY